MEQGGDVHEEEDVHEIWCMEWMMFLYLMSGAWPYRSRGDGHTMLKLGEIARWIRSLYAHALYIAETTNLISFLLCSDVRTS